MSPTRITESDLDAARDAALQCISLVRTLTTIQPALLRYDRNLENPKDENGEEIFSCPEKLTPYLTWRDDLAKALGSANWKAIQMVEEQLGHDEIVSWNGFEGQNYHHLAYELALRASVDCDQKPENPAEAIKRFRLFDYRALAMRIGKEHSVAIRRLRTEDNASKMPSGANGNETSTRIQLDKDTQTAILDNIPHKVDNPRAFAVYAAIVENKPQPLTRAQLQTKVKGTTGVKTIRKLLDELPEAVRNTVVSSALGYHFDADGKGQRRSSSAQQRSGKQSRRKKSPT